MRKPMLQAITALSLLLDVQGAETTAYLLGPGDQVSVSLRDLKEIEFKPARIDLDGNLWLHYAGRIPAAGLSAEELATVIEERLRSVVNNPRVTVEVSEFGSQPVSVLGAVNRPGIHQLRGHKTLIEVLSMAEGLRNEAGNNIMITRAKSAGRIPLPNSKEDASGQYNVAQVNLKALLEAKNPKANILIRPNDVISVPRAELVYVVGSVRKPGGFPLAERETLSVLQAISLAEGVDATAASQNARILRQPQGGGQRVEITVNVKKILASREPDQALQPNDILFIPNSTFKSWGLRTVEAGIQIATGVVIFRR